MSMVESAVEREKRSAAARFVRAVRQLQRKRGLDVWALSLAKRVIESDWRWAARFAFRLGQHFAAYDEAGGEPGFTNQRANRIARILSDFVGEVQRIEGKALHRPTI